MNEHLKNKTKKDLFLIGLASSVLTFFFKLQILMTTLKRINDPEARPCIYAIWHAHQFCLHGVVDRDKLHVLISPSNDGEIVSRATNAVGIKTIRGSHKRSGATKATIGLIEKLEGGNNIAITVDGPKGPKRECKPGIITIAKLSGVPIVPLIWYSKYPNFLKFKLSWDELRCPILPCKTILSYGEPIYVPSDADEAAMEQYRLKVEESLKSVYRDAQANFDKYVG